ncbi:MAG: hypothetical protein Q8O76_06220 [Chloroflexota bacterium]|nr:hypothetical protein [Chloroflexota bacterium]
MQEQTLTIREAAERLGVPQKRLRRLVQQGHVSSKRFHWMHLIEVADMDKIRQVLVEMDKKANRTKD